MNHQQGFCPQVCRFEGGAGGSGGAWGFELLELTNVSSRFKTLRPGDCSIWGQHYRASTRPRNTKWEKLWKRQDQREKRPVDRFGEIFMLQDKSHLWPDHLSFYVHFCRVVRRLELWLMVISLHFILLCRWCLNLLYFFIFGHIS